VLIRRHASSVNPVDDGIAAGMVKDTFRTSSRSPSAMSSRAVVEPIGDGVAGALTGDEGYGLVRCDGPVMWVGGLSRSSSPRSASPISLTALT
jgi:NADPH:quinone reductase-like Zn-dependent oxidoreductase